MNRETTGTSITWHAGALMYSGRPDPKWTVPESQADALLVLWDQLPLYPGWSEPPPRLGYRGCWLHAPDGRRWIAHDRVVVLLAPRDADASRSTVSDVRRDDQRAFERALLGTAPAGTSLPRV
jgi:hypothetical protein